MHHDTDRKGIDFAESRAVLASRPARSEVEGLIKLNTRTKMSIGLRCPREPSPRYGQRRDITVSETQIVHGICAGGFSLVEPECHGGGNCKPPPRATS
jgi:hypothetical protein